jgi:dolichol kinase
MGFSNYYLRKRMSLLGSFAFFSVVSFVAATFATAFSFVFAAFATAVMVMTTATSGEKSKRNDSEN